MAKAHHVTGITIYVALLLALPATASVSNQDDTLNRIELTVEKRVVKRENNVIRVTQDDQVELVWHSDEKAKLHLHGYDIEFVIVPGEPTVITFKAHATGRFPITSHGFGDEGNHGHDALLYLEVYPE